MDERDSLLIERLRNSDQGAFKLFFEKYQPILFRNVLYHCRDRDAAHDIVQETFIRVWKHRSSLRPEQSFLAYLFRISTNLVRDHAKHGEVRKRLQSEVPAPSRSVGDDPESYVELTLLQERVSEILKMKLPEKCRQVFLLSRMEEMSNAEIGAHLGLSVKTVENHMTKALKILRRNLRGYLGTSKA